jgi:hypothetical protein
MQKGNIRIVAFVALFLVFAMAMAAGAQQQKPIRTANRNNIAQNIGVQEFLRGLRLTEDQREAMKSILQSHRAEILGTREALLRARLELAKEDPKAPGDFGAAQAGLMNLRLRILDEIKGKLTQDQLAVLQERREGQIERLQKMLERVRERGTN